MPDVRGAFGTRDEATIRDSAGELWSKISSLSGVFLVTDPRGRVIASLGGVTPPSLQRNLDIVQTASAQFPGQALAVELYRHAGIRSVEIGSVMFGDQAQHELLRLAIPRRVYTQSHFDYVVEAILEVNARRSELRGLEIAEEPPFLLRDRHGVLAAEAPVGHGGERRRMAWLDDRPTAVRPHARFVDCRRFVQRTGVQGEC